MKLSHLGAQYTRSTMSVDTVETDTQLSFLGQRFKLRRAVAAPPVARRQQLTYRGVRYTP